MTDIDNVQASQRILAHLHEGRLVQEAWHLEDEHGRELACILGAIAPGIDDSRKCLSTVMPSWLAALTVPMFDGQSKADALAWAGRFGKQMARWHRLDDAAWDRVRASFCAACVADARLSADSAAAAAAVYWAARATDYAAADAAAADAADADAAAADAAAAAAANAAAVGWAVASAAARAAAAAAARQACWVRLATALCDAIDAELAASAAKETT
jgi:hypothetical protein